MSLAFTVSFVVHCTYYRVSCDCSSSGWLSVLFLLLKSSQALGKVENFSNEPWLSLPQNRTGACTPMVAWWHGGMVA